MIDLIKKRAAETEVKRAALAASLKDLIAQEDAAKARAVKARARISQAEPVKGFLDRLQKREHERAVGAYETLLTAFLNDVLPGDRSVVMELGSERGAPALDVFLRKGPGKPLEDAFEDTGGSVTNILSVGLRVIALLRSDRRKFLVLDESDCWIKPDLIPGFAKTVAQISKDLGVQILMVSHHEESLFEKHIKHRLRLDNSSGKLSAEWSPTSDIPEWGDDVDGIRSIEIKNAQAHEQTFINLSPEITLLQGDNDIGKSVIAGVLRGIFDQDSSESIIRHGESFCEVNIDFGKSNFILNWRRYRKGKVKMSYRMLSSDDFSVINSTDGTKTPDWLLPACGIGKCDGLDIQIGRQKKPVFLLDMPASERAKALSVGQETGYISGMMAFDKKDIQDARAALAEAETSLEYIRHRKSALSMVEAVQDTFDCSGLIGLVDSNNKINEITKKLSKYQEVCDLLENVPAKIEFTELTNNSDDVFKLAEKLNKSEELFKILDVKYPVIPKYPEIKSIDIEKIAYKMESVKSITDIISKMPSKINGLDFSGNNRELAIKLANKIIDINSEMEECSHDVMNLSAELKSVEMNVCPTCSRPI